MKTQLDAAMTHIKKLYTNNAILLKELSSCKVAEQRAVETDRHAQRLAETVTRLRLVTPQLCSAMSGALAAASESGDASASSALQLAELTHRFGNLSEQFEDALQINARLSEEIALNAHTIAVLQFESTEKGLEIERLRRELDVSAAETQEALAAGELAREERDQAKDQALAAAQRPPSAPPRAVPVQDMVKGRIASIVQLQSDLKISNQLVVDLKNKIKLLDSKVKHSNSKLEVAEVSRDALLVNVQQLKQKLELSGVRLSEASEQLRRVNTELESLRERSSLEESHLISENKRLKNELFSEHKRFARLNEEFTSIREALRAALEDESTTGRLVELARDHGLDDPNSNFKRTEEWGDENSSSVNVRFDDEPLDASVAISFIGSALKNIPDDSSLFVESPQECAKIPTPTPIRRLWNSISVPVLDDAPLHLVDDDTVISVSLASRDVAPSLPTGVSFDFGSVSSSPRKDSPPKPLLKKTLDKFNGTTHTVHRTFMR